MSIDITVNITNYVAENTYKVYLYKKGTNTPLATKEILRNAGANVEFTLLPEGVTYEVEVVQKCEEGDSTRRLEATAAGVKVCYCSSGYTANADNTRCVKITTVAPIVTGAAFNVAPGPDEQAYCREGIKVYAPGFMQDGRGATVYASGPTHTYWASLNNISLGRLNKIGVWNADSSSAPIGKWIGFSKTIEVTETKLYWVAVAGDNYCRIKVNGALLIDQYQNKVDVVNVHFNYWHCYPVLLNAGTNIIEMDGYNSNGPGCFGAEIYSCTLEALQAVTPGTEASLNRIFSTGDTTQFNNNYSCQAGYALDYNNGNPVCRKIEYEECI